MKIRSLLALGLLGGLGDLTGTLVGLDDRLDDTDGNGLAHVANGETTKRWIVLMDRKYRVGKTMSCYLR